MQINNITYHEYGDTMRRSAIQYNNNTGPKKHLYNSGIVALGDFMALKGFR
jgi:hypothetical protein